MANIILIPRIVISASFSYVQKDPIVIKESMLKPQWIGTTILKVFQLCGVYGF